MKIPDYAKSNLVSRDLNVHITTYIIINILYYWKGSADGSTTKTLKTNFLIERKKNMIGN